MASASVGGTSLSFEYDIDGLRTKKTIQNGETYNYYYSGGKLLSMTWENGEKSLNFLYDGSGNPYSVVYKYTENGVNYSSSYYYVTNLQGDVIAILAAGHAVMAEYTYDAWGNILSVTNSSGTDISGDATHIANLNPLRYRGYVYDNETGFYYLQSRYYDPAVGRFVNGDVLLLINSFLGYNQFTYCMNNSVMQVDSDGEAPDEFWIERAKMLKRKKYAKSFGKGHNVPYYMSPASDFGDPSDESEYTCVARNTYKRKLSSEERDSIATNTTKNFVVDRSFQALGFLSSSLIAGPSEAAGSLYTAYTIYEWSDFANFTVNGCIDTINHNNIKITDCEYTATVAIYRNPEGKYAVVNKITSDSASSYNAGWSLSYNYDSNKSLKYYAFPSSIGVVYK